MYISHIEEERFERNRQLMRDAAHERLVTEALAGRRDKTAHRSAPAAPGTWIMAQGAAAASLVLAFLGQLAWPRGH